MGSFDLGGSFAAGGAAQALRDLFQQRVQQTALMQRDRALNEETRQHLAEEALKGRSLDEQTAYRQMQQQENERMHQANEAVRQGTEGQHLADTIPPNTFLGETDPAVATMEKTGYGSLLTKQPAIQAQGPDFQGPTPEGTTIADYANGRAPGRLKTASASQSAAAASAKRLAEKEAADETYRQGMLKVAQQNANQKQNAPGATVVVQTVDDQGNPVTKIVPKTAGDVYAKPASAVTQNRLDSAKAVTQTGNDIIAKLQDPAIKAMVGPAMGRFNTLRDLIGNPPPELAGLAGQIESYALANMGVHGMRSTQGAAQISKLLDQHHTPESLIAAIQGLNGFSEHFMQNAGMKSGGASGSEPKKKTAAELIQQYGGPQ